MLRDDIERRSFSIIYLKAGKIIAPDCVNEIKDYVQGRSIVAREAEIEPKKLRDSSIPLKGMLDELPVTVANYASRAGLRPAPAIGFGLLGVTADSDCNKKWSEPSRPQRPRDLPGYLVAP